MLYTLIYLLLTSYHFHKLTTTPHLTVVFNESSKLLDGMPKLELYRSYT